MIENDVAKDLRRKLRSKKPVIPKIPKKAPVIMKVSTTTIDSRFNTSNVNDGNWNYVISLGSESTFKVKRIKAQNPTKKHLKAKREYLKLRARYLNVRKFDED